MGNNTEEEGSEFITVNMICITVAWDALYRGSCLAGRTALFSYTSGSSARNPVNGEHSTT